LKFVEHDEIVTVEDMKSGSITFYGRFDKLEKELINKAPEDKVEIKKLVKDIRRLAKWQMPSPNDKFFSLLGKLVKTLPVLPVIRRYSRMTVGEYAKKYQNVLLKKYFGGGGMPNLSMLALVFSIVWMGSEDGAYPIGGSGAFIRLVEDTYTKLGGKIRFNTRVTKIIVEGGMAKGVVLQNGESLRADTVVSAADGYDTIYNMLEGKFLNEKVEKPFKNYETFTSYLMVSLGVDMDLKKEKGLLSLMLDKAIKLDDKTSINDLAVRIFNFDPTFAPKGKTAITCFLPTANYEYWVTLRKDHLKKYGAEKQRIANEVLAVLDKKIPGLSKKVEVIDVATPATVVRYTNNWRGSMEGWLIKPGVGLGAINNTLPGVKNFYMIGQWTQPGGGLPSGLISARSIARRVIKDFGGKFKV
jgi:phytoene dehydrogenase-like protein